ncbi:M50 family metallopeptidase [Cellulomonas chengniuliangii]|uniref:Site-2 protease family protein n=1 Tax=Cellulomonas chengniuliangii TaxID=2968084 RepID=A0ABY5KWU4_9CELL|nr:site-2 protease family protein [Cellulomonas chengniuliangii]MCC2309067.1 site-2 protease family protein [Cellulomonas chengniuliangii]UUI74205.1 site-2 protease family protein [Cellulomonas chengniuliangii]
MAYLLGVVVLVLGVLVSIGLHEIGHMVPAKRFGVRVSQYMVGFGPTLWSRTKGETEYGLKAIPLGGYVRLVGMYPTAEAVGDPPARTTFGKIAAQAREASAQEILPGEDHRAFYRLSTPKKVVVMLGGPFMNLLIAIVLLTVVISGFGVAASSTTLSAVSQCVIPAGADASRECGTGDEPAPGAAAGLQPGDTVIAYDGVEVTGWDQLSALIQQTGDRTVPIVVERDGDEVATTVTPVVAERPVYEDGVAVTEPDGSPVTHEVGFLGISPSTELQTQPVSTVPGVVGNAVAQTLGVVVTLPARVADVAQSAFGSAERDESTIISVVGVGRFAGEIASADAEGFGTVERVASMLTLLASLNIALFAFNLIPLLPLDGGHVVGALWEGARRQIARLRRRAHPGPFDTARLVPLAYGVFVLLAGMGALLIYADVVNPVTLG